MPRKYVLVGKHDLSPKQLRLLKVAGLTDMVKRFRRVDSVSDLVKYASARDCAVVVQGLPVNMMAELVTEARKVGVDVYTFAVKTAFSLPDRDACPEWCDVVVKRGNLFQCRFTSALHKVKKVVFEYDEVVKTSKALTRHLPPA